VHGVIKKKLGDNQEFEKSRKYRQILKKKVEKKMQLEIGIQGLHHSWLPQLSLIPAAWHRG
jgi:hypothetical protein